MTTTTPSTITGRLTTVGRIAVCDNYLETTYGEDLDIEVVSGILIVMDDTNVRAAASMFGKTIEVYEHHADIEDGRGINDPMIRSLIAANANLRRRLEVAETQTLTDPSNISVHPQAFRCEGFPRQLTQADIDALYKRATDAEDHLRREVASNQALISKHENLCNSTISALADRDATIANLRASNDDIRAKYVAEKYLADECAEVVKARDQTIANLMAIANRLVSD